jgi:2-amino-4-hydroxy-6-hydroxymethyldihydropteridine diphosphokinase
MAVGGPLCFAKEYILYMNNAYLLMGGNVGDSKKSLLEAAGILEAECGTIVRKSSIYNTAPWGKTDQQNFLNQALLLNTKLSPKELMRNILLIEEKMGRQRLEKNGPRVIDIDILFYNDLVLEDHLLTIPHPALHYRRFALIPLAEIAPTFIHPVLKKDIQQLLLDCADHLEVSLFE